MVHTHRALLAVVSIAAFGTAASFNTAPAVASDSAAEAVEARQTLFKEMGSSMRALGGVARGTVEPDKAVMLRHAQRVTANSRQIAAAFNTDTRRSGLETEARPAIWTSRSDFNAKARALTTASVRLNSAIDSGDMGAFRSALGGVGQSCKDCHDTYRDE